MLSPGISQKKINDHGSRPITPLSVAPTSPVKGPIETFSFLVVEEFLMRKGMVKTLQTFRSEWRVGDEEESVFSWYDVAAKLRLPNMIRQHSLSSSSSTSSQAVTSEPTVLESMTSALATEASVRMRQPVDLITSGLATFPKATALNMAAAVEANPNEKPLTSKSLQPQQTANESFLTSTGMASENADNSKGAGANNNNNNNDSSRRKKKPSGQRKTALEPLQLMSMNSDKSKFKTSSENWIPEINRIQSLHRHISVAKETLNDIIMREVTAERETRRLLKSDIDRAHEEEALNTKKKIKCACCYQSFSYVSLPLTVSVKAVIDMRKKWSAENGMTQGWWSASDAKLSRIPRCYSEVLVCLFCSQFFADQESYRPTFETITYNKKMAEWAENKRREKEYWDPLKMCEKDRLLAEEAERLALSENKASGIEEESEDGI